MTNTQTHPHARIHTYTDALMHAHTPHGWTHARTKAGTDTHTHTDLISLWCILVHMVFTSAARLFN